MPANHSHPLSPLCPPAPTFSQRQGLFPGESVVYAVVPPTYLKLLSRSQILLSLVVGLTTNPNPGCRPTLSSVVCQEPQVKLITIHFLSYTSQISKVLNSTCPEWLLLHSTAVEHFVLKDVSWIRLLQKLYPHISHCVWPGSLQEAAFPQPP